MRGSSLWKDLSRSRHRDCRRHQARGKAEVCMSGTGSKNNLSHARTVTSWMKHVDSRLQGGYYLRSKSLSCSWPQDVVGTRSFRGQAGMSMAEEPCMGHLTQRHSIWLRKVQNPRSLQSGEYLGEVSLEVSLLEMGYGSGWCFAWHSHSSVLTLAESYLK